MVYNFGILTAKIAHLGCLEHETSMDIERIIVDSRREHDINMIAISLIFISNFRLLVQRNFTIF